MESTAFGVGNLFEKRFMEAWKAQKAGKYRHTVIAFVKSDGSVNLFRKQDADTITGKTTEKIGWDTDQKSKAFAIDTLKKDLKEGRCVPHSIEAYDELRVFVHGERGKMGALKGHHDDRVIALGLANVAAQQAGIGSILIGYAHAHAQEIFCDATNVIADIFKVYVGEPRLKAPVNSHKQAIGRILAAYARREYEARAKADEERNPRDENAA